MATIPIGNGDLRAVEDIIFEAPMLGYEDVFAFEDAEIGRLAPHIEEEYSFLTVDHKPWAFESIPLARETSDMAARIIARKLEAGTLEYAQSPHRNRYFIVPKKHGRLIIDAQPINKVTLKDAGSPPNVDAFSEAFAGVPISSLGDMFSGYDQFRLDPACRDLTAFFCDYGLVRSTVMVQGCTNSVGSFQRIMLRTLRKLIPDNVSVFTDDVATRRPMPRDEGADHENHPDTRRFTSKHVHILARSIFD